MSPHHSLRPNTLNCKRWCSTTEKGVAQSFSPPFRILGKWWYQFSQKNVHTGHKQHINSHTISKSRKQRAAKNPCKDIMRCSGRTAAQAEPGNQGMDHGWMVQQRPYICSTNIRAGSPLSLTSQVIICIFLRYLIKASFFMTKVCGSVKVQQVSTHKRWPVVHSFSKPVWAHPTRYWHALLTSSVK